MPAKTQNNMKSTSPSKSIQRPNHQAPSEQNRNLADPGKVAMEGTVDPVEAQREADVDKMMGWQKEQDFDSHSHPSGRAWKFYKSVPWEEWWEEFVSAMEPDGRLRYRTVDAFIQAKAKNEYEKELLWEMIGPTRPQKSLRVPYLGDWEKRRAQGFWSFEDPGKMASIKQALKHAENPVAAASAIAPLAAKQIQRYARIAEKIDEAFGGQPFLAALPPDHPKNKARFDAYLNMHGRVSVLERKAYEAYWMSYGLNPKDPASWAAMAGAVSIQDTVSPGAAKLDQLLGEITKYDVLLAANMRQKAEMYPGLELPRIIPLPE